MAKDKALTKVALPSEIRTLPHKAQRVASALIRTGGIKARAAKLLGVSRQAVQNACQRHAELDALRHRCLEEHLDLAEDQLFAAARKGKAWAVKFLLERLGADRGYARHLDLDADVRAAAEIRVIQHPPKARDEAEWERDTQIETDRLDRLAGATDNGAA